MASAAFSEPMGLVREPRLEVRLQQEAYYFADELAGPRRQAEGTEL
jgi:hypothetical protein